MDDRTTKSETGNMEKIDSAINKFFESLEGSEKKLSVADAIRLLELRKQLASEAIREVTVTWVESKQDQFVIKG